MASYRLNEIKLVDTLQTFTYTIIVGQSFAYRHLNIVFSNNKYISWHIDDARYEHKEVYRLKSVTFATES